MSTARTATTFPPAVATPARVSDFGSLRLMIIDRYLLRQFWQAFLICFCSLTGLYFVIYGFNNLDEFINYAEKQGGLLVVMGSYYAYRSFSFFDSMSHILTLIAAMFTSFYSWRLIHLTFHGKPRWGHDAHAASPGSFPSHDAVALRERAARAGIRRRDLPGRRML